MQWTLTTDLRSVGFRVSVRRSYGRYALAPRRAAFLCRKP